MMGSPSATMMEAPMLEVVVCKSMMTSVRGLDGSLVVENLGPSI